MCRFYLRAQYSVELARDAEMQMNYIPSEVLESCRQGDCYEVGPGPQYQPRQTTVLKIALAARFPDYRASVSSIRRINKIVLSEALAIISRYALVEVFLPRAALVPPSRIEYSSGTLRVPRRPREFSGGNRTRTPVNDVGEEARLPGSVKMEERSSSAPCPSLLPAGGRPCSDCRDARGTPRRPIRASSEATFQGRAKNNPINYNYRNASRNATLPRFLRDGRVEIESPLARPLIETVPSSEFQNIPVPSFPLSRQNRVATIGRAVFHDKWG